MRTLESPRLLNIFVERSWRILPINLDKIKVVDEDGFGLDNLTKSKPKTRSSMRNGFGKRKYG